MNSGTMLTITSTHASTITQRCAIDQSSIFV
jgi:hypothetical protein